MEPGIYSIPFEEYLADPCPTPSASRSTLHKILTHSAEHARLEHPKLGARPSGGGRRADFGSAAHDVNLTGGGRLHVIEAIYPPKHKKAGEPVENYMTNVAKEERDEAQAAGRIPVLRSEEEDLLRMNERFCEFIDVKGISLSKCERTVLWTEQVNGLEVWCKARPDIMDHGSRVAYDYKTATTASPSLWVKRTLFPGGYDIQAAWYVRGIKAVLGEDWAFKFIPQEITQPYSVSLVRATESVMNHANTKIEKALDIFADCLKNDRWPEYETEFEPDVPTYERFDMEGE